MWDFPGAADLAKLGAAIYEQGGAVAAVCHGPPALVELRLSDGGYLMEGKNVTGFTNAEETAVRSPRSFHSCSPTP
jgi:putative intracellular protease/amidase